MFFFSSAKRVLIYKTYTLETGMLKHKMHAPQARLKRNLNKFPTHIPKKNQRTHTNAQRVYKHMNEA